MIKERLLTDYPSAIYICLDEDKMYTEPGHKLQMPYFDNFEKILLPHYSKLNSSLDSRITQPKKKSSRTAAKPKENRDAMSLKAEKDNCLNIIETFKMTLQSKVLKYIPHEPIFRNKKVMPH